MCFAFVLVRGTTIANFLVFFLFFLARFGSFSVTFGIILEGFWPQFHQNWSQNHQQSQFGGGPSRPFGSFFLILATLGAQMAPGPPPKPRLLMILAPILMELRPKTLQNDAKGDRKGAETS
jgi:hypothetical protein